MNIKNYLAKTVDFLIKRLIEILGIIFAILGILLFLSLLTYSTEDPNFIYSGNESINNILGFRGSFVSDFFLQTIGLMSFLFSTSIFFIGINIIFKKKLLIILENFFYVILYSLLGTLFLSSYYNTSFSLPINGNGGFVGKMLSKGFLEKIILEGDKISYFILLILVIFLFSLSINFKLKFFLNKLKSLNQKIILKIKIKILFKFMIMNFLQLRQLGFKKIFLLSNLQKSLHGDG